MVHDDKGDLFKSWFQQYSSAYITQVAQTLTATKTDGWCTVGLLIHQASIYHVLVTPKAIQSLKLHSASIIKYLKGILLVFAEWNDAIRFITFEYSWIHLNLFRNEFTHQQSITNLVAFT